MPKAGQFPEVNKEGEFVRQEDAFRDWVRRNGSTLYPPESGRYHLYVSLACPWAHRTLIARRLKNLQGYLQDLSQQPKIRDTVNLERIKAHYYVTHTEINPTGIVPIGPDLELARPHGRA